MNTLINSLLVSKVLEKNDFHRFEHFVVVFVTFIAIENLSKISEDAKLKVKIVTVAELLFV